MIPSRQCFFTDANDEGALRGLILKTRVESVHERTIGREGGVSDEDLEKTIKDLEKTIKDKKVA